MLAWIKEVLEQTCFCLLSVALTLPALLHKVLEDCNCKINQCCQFNHQRAMHMYKDYFAKRNPLSLSNLGTPLSASLNTGSANIPRDDSPLPSFNN